VHTFFLLYVHTYNFLTSYLPLVFNTTTEIRTGFFADGAKKIELTKGESLTLTADYNFLGNNKKLACSYPTLATSVKTGQSILVADGSLVLTVLSCHPSEGEVICRIENDCSIGERKNMVSFCMCVRSMFIHLLLLPILILFPHFNI